MAEAAVGERRKYQRIATDQVISFADAGTGEHRAVSRDLSVAGIRFEAVACEIETGEVLRVTFTVGDQAVVAIGKVAWATETDAFTTDVGLEFIDIDPTVITMLEEMVGEVEL